MFRVSKHSLKGPEGLLLAVFLQALEDLHQGKELHRMSAAAYFKSSNFKQHLAMLDLPQSLTPDHLMACVAC